eukprot:scaffold63739_cov59-Attheya_sp.AAC.2
MGLFQRREAIPHKNARLLLSLNAKVAMPAGNTEDSHRNMVRVIDLRSQWDIDIAYLLVAYAGHSLLNSNMRIASGKVARSIWNLACAKGPIPSDSFFRILCGRGPPAEALKQKNVKKSTTDINRSTPPILM